MDKQEFSKAGKSLLAGAGATFVGAGGLYLSGVLSTLSAHGVAVAQAAFFPHQTYKHIDVALSRTSAVGWAVELLGLGASLFFATKVFRLSPRRWWAAGAAATTLIGGALILPQSTPTSITVQNTTISSTPPVAPDADSAAALDRALAALTPEKTKQMQACLAAEKQRLQGIIDSQFGTLDPNSKQVLLTLQSKDSLATCSQKINRPAAKPHRDRAPVKAAPSA